MLIELDGRQMLPPEPLERVLDHLPRLGPDDCLAIHLRHEPHPLYEILAERGFRWQTRCLGTANYRVEIRPAATDADH